MHSRSTFKFKKGKESRILYMSKDLDAFICGQKKGDYTDKLFHVRDVEDVRQLKGAKDLQTVKGIEGKQAVRVRVRIMMIFGPRVVCSG